MFDLISGLLQAKAHVQDNPGAQVTISLPLDDPRSQKLLNFAKKLMIPTVKIRKSGLTTKTGIEHTGNTDEFLQALQQTVGDELYYELMSDLNGQLALQQDKLDDAVMGEIQTNPQAMSGLLHQMGEKGALSEMPNRERLINFADDLGRGGK